MTTRNRSGQAQEAVVGPDGITFRPVTDPAGAPVDRRTRNDTVSSGGSVTNGVLNPPAPTINQQVASSLRSVLASYDLEELGPMVDQWVRDGITSQAELELLIMDPSGPASSIVRQKYGIVFELRERGERASIQDVRDYRQFVRTTNRAARFPEGYYDTNEQIDDLLRRGMSRDEYKERVVDGYVAVDTNFSPEARQFLTSRYNLGSGDLAAYFLEKDKSVAVIRRQMAAARIGGAAGQMGADLSAQSVERYLEFGLDEGQARNVFAQARDQLPTLSALNARFGDPSDPLTVEDFADAIVLKDPDDLRLFTRLVRQGTAEFSGGGVATDQTGAQRGLLAR